MHFPRRRFAVALGAAVAAWAGTLLVMLVYGVVDIRSALHLTALSGAFGAVGLLAVLVRRNTAQLRSLRLRFDRHAREIAEIAGENRSELFARADDLTGRLARMEESVHALCDASAGGGGERAVPAVREPGTPAEGRAVRELEALLGPDAPMPAPGEDGVSPETVERVVRAVRDRRPHLVVEVGSGASTLWLGLALRRFRAGRLVALESDPRCAGLVRAMVAAHGLSGVVEVRGASDLDGLHGIDLLHLTRVTGAAGVDAVPDLFDRCAPGALVIPGEDHGARGPGRGRASAERSDAVLGAGASADAVRARAAS
ncbi:hypothetical protein ABZ234_19540 [Nocardiopsis sp. NPDC006198]|uniref:hypothetical protein n=1 Tax=Nocardiopsis sp. NPDC006198 TaxID=3154472 RepID=UPI0033A34F4A